MVSLGKKDVMTEDEAKKIEGSYTPAYKKAINSLVKAFSTIKNVGGKASNKFKNTSKRKIIRAAAGTAAILYIGSRILAGGPDYSINEHRNTAIVAETQLPLSIDGTEFVLPEEVEKHNEIYNELNNNKGQLVEIKYKTTDNGELVVTNVKPIQSGKVEPGVYEINDSRVSINDIEIENGVSHGYANIYEIGGQSYIVIGYVDIRKLNEEYQEIAKIGGYGTQDGQPHMVPVAVPYNQEIQNTEITGVEIQKCGFTSDDDGTDVIFIGNLQSTTYNTDNNNQ